MTTARVERRLAAILAADVVAYSRLMGEDEAGTLARLKAHRKELVEPLIAEHHGTTLIHYFFHKAKDLESTPTSVSETDYRYPGRKPQTRESALVMLGDSIEAASRSIADPTPARLQGMVTRIINNKFSDGQLEECDLTLRDLHAPFYIVVGDSLSRTVRPGEQITVPLFASFMADTQPAGDSLFMHFELYGWNSIGEKKRPTAAGMTRNRYRIRTNLWPERPAPRRGARRYCHERGGATGLWSGPASLVVAVAALARGRVECFARALSGRNQRDAPRVHALAAVLGERRIGDGDLLPELHCVAPPARTLQTVRGTELGAPVGDFTGLVVLHVEVDPHMRVGPLNLRHDAAQRYALRAVELRRE